MRREREAKAEESVVDEAVLYVVPLVDVLHNRLTFILYQVLDRSISAEKSTKIIVAIITCFIDNGRRGKQGAETREGSVANMRCAAACASAAEIPLTRILVLLKSRARPASCLNACLMSERTSRATESIALM